MIPERTTLKICLYSSERLVGVIFPVCELFGAAINFMSIPAPPYSVSKLMAWR